ncbi:MAG TPA: glycosyltransferase, partial [Thermoanaerobaculia bacterium]|nr:glycosyltransferase [Thermoanaerobaculia bacterium]
RRCAAAVPEVAVTVVDNPEGIVPTGMNRAIAVARGDVVVRVDGHTIVDPDYVRQCVSALRRSGAQNVGGRMTAVGEGAFARAVAAATSSRFGVGGARFHYSGREEWVDTVYMGAWPKSVLDALGGFDPEMVRDQDDELNYRLRERGGRILLCPLIRSRYFNRPTVRSLARQYFQYGWWKVRVMQKHPRQMRPRQFAPPALAAGLGAAAAASLVWRPAVGALALLAGTYAAADLAASAAAARRSGASPLLVGVAFATLHLSYGFGFLSGLARFWNRWDVRRTAAVRRAEEVSWSSRCPSIDRKSPARRSPKSSRRSAPAG